MAGKEEAMSIKASEVADWLRQRAGKRDYRELMREDAAVLRPGPNFHWLMGPQPLISLHRQHLNRTRQARVAA